MGDLRSEKDAEVAEEISKFNKLISVAKKDVFHLARKVLLITRADKTSERQALQNKYDELLKIVNIPTFLSNAAAIAGGLSIGHVYRNGDDLKIVH